MQPPDVTRLNICVMPPKDVAGRLIEFAADLPTASQLFRIDGRTRLPHLTLFMTAFSESSIEEVVRRLKLVPMPRFARCTAQGVTLSANGYVEIGYAKSTELGELQTSVAAAIADLRVVDQHTHDYDMTELEAANLDAYGYKLFGDAFRPHVTLAAYSPGSQVTLPFSGTYAPLDFDVHSIAVAESDELGSVVNLHEVIPLS